jgi:hypothetical protein
MIEKSLQKADLRPSWMIEHIWESLQTGEDFSLSSTFGGFVVLKMAA